MFRPYPPPPQPLNADGGPTHISQALMHTGRLDWRLRILPPCPYTQFTRPDIPDWVERHRAHLPLLTDDAVSQFRDYHRRGGPRCAGRCVERDVPYTPSDSEHCGWQRWNWVERYTTHTFCWADCDCRMALNVSPTTHVPRCDQTFLTCRDFAVGRNPQWCGHS